METRDELMHALQEIERWERDQKDLWFWEKLGRLPFVLLDRVTPKIVREKMGQAIDEMVSYVETGGRYLIRESEITNRFAAKTGGSELTTEQVGRLPLRLLDQVANDVSKARAKFATVQGAATGIGGIFTLAIDIPMLLGLSLKVLQEMCLCYGYNPNDKAERLFIIKCMQFTSSDFVGKKAIIEDLTEYDNPDKRHQLFAQMQGWREVLLVQTENFGWKKLFQMIPIAGILFGAYLNRKTIEETAEVARMLYRKRRVLERLESGSRD
ncbi:MAG: EcsC family protein [Tumebacillaceae bacterium]